MSGDLRARCRRLTVRSMRLGVLPRDNIASTHPHPPYLRHRIPHSNRECRRRSAAASTTRGTRMACCRLRFRCRILRRTTYPRFHRRRSAYVMTTMNSHCWKKPPVDSMMTKEEVTTTIAPLRSCNLPNIRLPTLCCRHRIVRRCRVHRHHTPDWPQRVRRCIAPCSRFLRPRRHHIVHRYLLPYLRTSAACMSYDNVLPLDRCSANRHHTLHRHLGCCRRTSAFCNPCGNDRGDPRFAVHRRIARTFD